MRINKILDLFAQGESLTVIAGKSKKSISVKSILESVLRQTSNLVVDPKLKDAVKKWSTEVQESREMQKLCFSIMLKFLQVHSTEKVATVKFSDSEEPGQVSLPLLQSLALESKKLHEILEAPQISLPITKSEYELLCKIATGKKLKDDFNPEELSHLLKELDLEAIKKDVEQELVDKLQKSSLKDPSIFFRITQYVLSLNPYDKALAKACYERFAMCHFLKMRIDRELLQRTIQQIEKTNSPLTSHFLDFLKHIGSKYTSTIQMGSFTTLQAILCIDKNKVFEAYKLLSPISSPTKFQEMLKFIVDPNQKDADPSFAEFEGLPLELIYFGKAEYFIFKNALEKAVENCTKSIEISSESLALYNSRYLCNFSLKQFQKAIEDLNILLNFDETSTWFLKRSSCYENLNNLSMAQQDLTNAERVSGNSPNENEVKSSINQARSRIYSKLSLQVSPEHFFKTFPSLIEEAARLLPGGFGPKESQALVALKQSITILTGVQFTSAPTLSVSAPQPQLPSQFTPAQQAAAMAAAEMAARRTTQGQPAGTPTLITLVQQPRLPHPLPLHIQQYQMQQQLLQYQLAFMHKQQLPPQSVQSAQLEVQGHAGDKRPPEDRLAESQDKRSKT